MLLMKLPIQVGDSIWVCQVVVHGLACKAMGSRTIRLFPADCRIDRHMGHMDALWHRFPGHALGQARLAVLRCGKRTAARIAFQRGAGIGEHDRAFVPVPALEWKHCLGRLLADEECTERRVR